MKLARPASIRGRLVRALVLWSALWCVVLGVAVWIAVQEEVDELLDDSLQSAAEGLFGPLAQNLVANTAAAAMPPATVSRRSEARQGRFVWQLVAHEAGAVVIQAAPGAPSAALHAAPRLGFSDVPGWRVYGAALGPAGRVIYVAQTTAERVEAKFEVALAVLLTGLPMAALATLWLRARVRRELQPLQDLSQRLAVHDPLQPGATLGPAEHEELRPVHAAIDALAARLARRVAHERAFTAHAAHSLRTPLAGIDAQLAVALREAAPPQQARLQRVRGAAQRLQRVVVALLTLFRSGAEVERTTFDLQTLVTRLPLEGLALDVQAGAVLAADADLLTAALLNLLDNSLRHGAHRVTLCSPAPGVLSVADDGPGVDATRRQALQHALDTQDYAGRTGLGLMLADMVARAHGGRLELPAVARGFAAVLHLGGD